ncbi:hypothetical protein BJV74DRAFT_847300 [Russula compacta]|nr:hypothetical protein BJV74DRAFT_847300 [Russula compacta]
MLEILFDLLEVLRFLRFERGILHRDISVGNVMYIENPEIPAQEAVEPLIFAKYLLKEGRVPQETSLLLVDFNVGEDLGNKKGEKRIERTGTPIFISRAVERGKPVPLDAPFYLQAEVPKSPGCYANAHAHSNRIDDFPEEIEDLLVDPRKNKSQDDGWRLELDHDVESVFWLFLYWAMVAQPKGRPAEYINPISWASLLGNYEERDVFIWALRLGRVPENLTHSFYKPLSPLITSLAAILFVDKHWLPQSDVRKRPDYIYEAFQRLIIQFIVSNPDKDFMTCRVDNSLRRVQQTQLRDGLERETEAKRRRLYSTDDEDDNESSRMIQ